MIYSKVLLVIIEQWFKCKVWRDKVISPYKIYNKLLSLTKGVIFYLLGPTEIYVIIPFFSLNTTI